MHLIDGQIPERNLQGFVALPVIILPDDLPPVRESISVRRSVSPDTLPRDRLRVRVQQNPCFIKAQSSLRVIDTVEAVPVFHRLDLNAENHHGVDIADPELLRKRNLREGLPLSAMVEHQCTPGCLLGKDTEIHTIIFDQGRSEGKHTSDPVLQSL